MIALDDARMDHFDRLTRDEQAAVIRRMAAEGMSDHSIAAATRLSVEFVREVVGERVKPL